MNDIVRKFEELDLLLNLVLAKISKVHSIMYAQDIGLLTPAIEIYRAKYLRQLHQHRKIIEQQQNELLDQIDIEEILSVISQQ
jgi:hypothetical protein